MDSSFVEYVKERITESKLSFGCGLVLNLSDLNFAEIEDNLVKLMNSGLRFSILTQAGKTLDPGFSKLKNSLLEISLQNNLPIESIPGASFVTYVLSQSGFPSDSFVYQGDLIGSKIYRINQLESLRKNLQTTVLRA